ncbi:pyridoxamine 5'-phosphate oxidase [Niabella ginsenosidivorans]|uniref:Pyridoxine/pyridoxamine 5'-phosphate oxidase n=1 Tax=Niabella ginsenosidivorans TaxID=1176587 RepID=A0A1A9HWA3_9BACT|nr:pyridoxamine 5'-phosphate oxidase [Niabella ginsenosidivorans]ANH79688.1 pyridoxamine 5'-phosphate oxidase [Niabella ginsenosidivorans]
MHQNIADIRINYYQKSLSETDVASEPIAQFNNWWQEALNSQLSEVNAMTLATANANGLPDARIVLLKGVTEKGFVFFTNYESAKGKELEQNPRACLVFFWKELERQVRVTGSVSKVPKKESENYFYSRPVGSQIGAVVSPQSSVIPDRTFLDARTLEFTKRAEAGEKIIKPEHWGGFLVSPVRIEFWQGRPNRLHDRLLYTLQDNGTWKIERLAP